VSWRRLICTVFKHDFFPDYYYWDEQDRKVIIEFCYQCDNMRKRVTSEKKP
jgi:hypothetical protein